MENKEIIKALNEEITLLYNCTDDPTMKMALKEINLQKLYNQLKEALD